MHERDLPARLQEEFALLAGGLISNVALATIASIRDATHHVLFKMGASMDAPYFHHRATLPMADDAEEYSVDVVLSELKSNVDKRGVGQKYTGAGAIGARIREMAGGEGLNLRYQKGGATKNFPVTVDQAIGLISDGCKSAHGRIAGDKPPVTAFEREISTLFQKDSASAHAAMREFAALTGVKSHPGSELYKTGKKLPQLGLGTVIRDSRKSYYLCLQATCDAVRLKRTTGFLFVPLSKEAEKPEHVIPVLGALGKIEYIGLSSSSRAYAETHSVRFDPDGKSQSVLAKKIKSRRGNFFVDVEGQEYRWIADLKQRRALRTAQRLGHKMARLGFDEFEPFRRNDD